MPEIWEVSPPLSAVVASQGVADAAGNINLDPNVDGTGTSIDGRISDFILYGVFNGAFSRGPTADPTGNIDPINNPMPDWAGPTQVSGGAITTSWVADSASPSSYNLRFTIAPGAAGDEAYHEQIVPIGGDRMRRYAIQIRAAVYRVVASGGTPKLTAEGQFLTASGATTGSAFSNTRDLLADATAYNLSAIPSVSPPSDASQLRLRYGVQRNTMAASDTATIDLVDVRLDRNSQLLMIPDQTDPATYAPNSIYSTNDVLTLLGSATTYGQFDGAGGDVSLTAAADINLNTAGAVNIAGGLTLSNVISPTALSAATDDWNPTGLSSCGVIRVSSDAARSLRGIVAQASGTLIRLMNVGAFTITLKYDDANSAAANRFYGATSADVLLRKDGWVDIFYDGTSSRWRVSGA